MSGAPESPYHAIARAAVRATPRRLLLVLALSVTVLAYSALGAGTWPLTALAVGSAAAAVASAALWGIVAHVAARHPTSRVLSPVELLLAIAGTLLAVVAALALVLALLGRPWML